ncbi:MAG TPA: hypothetical protein VFZ34_04390 [Blastocatellia bacterium]|nr:hypothetical protein [Blastocatellia bacterium]
MLTGYNTDVSYGGEVFHIQTEDKGVQSPIILSLVYRAGTILAAKRTSYSNLICNGVVDELAVAQILTRQHQILVAAIQAGKSEKLVELSRQQSSRGTAMHHPVPGAEAVTPSRNNGTAPTLPAPRAEATARSIPHRKAASTSKAERTGTATAMLSDPKPVEAISFDQIIAGYLQNTPTSEQLRVEVLYPSRFRAGDEVTVRAAILSGGTTPTAGAHVKLQILGTKIEAQTWTRQTDSQGLVSFHVKVPRFTGAAALILKAQAPNGQEAEAKFMIGQR